MTMTVLDQAHEAEDTPSIDMWTWWAGYLASTLRAVVDGDRYGPDPAEVVAAFDVWRAEQLAVTA